jgi:DNA-binding Lrp family transcriptional regulator
MARLFDDLDRNLMRELQHRADRSNAQLATKLSVSSSTVHRRVVELKAAGVLTGVVAVMNPKAAKREMTFVANAKISSTLTTDLEPFERWIEACVEVQGAFLMADDNAMLLTLRVRDIEDLNRLLETIQAANPVVTEVAARATRRTIKQTLLLPVDDLQGRMLPH